MTASVKKLVVIIPALNEEKTVADVISSIPRVIPGVSLIKVVVVDDGSTDTTRAKAEAAGAEVIEHGRTLGVGAAFHTGIKHALSLGADIIANIDADGQFNSADIPKLIEPILQDRAGFVTATRFAKQEFMPDMPPIKWWGNRWMTKLINFVTRQNFTDVSCGFRAYSRETALKLTLFGHFTYTQETFIDLTFKRISMKEIPLRVRGERQYGHSRVASNLWRYGTKSATIIFRAARDYYPLYFFGLPGMIVLVCGAAVGIFLLVHFLRTGHTAPYRSLVTVSGAALTIGFLFIFLSMLADMLHRNRLLLEEQLYYLRSIAYRKENDEKH